MTPHEIKALLFEFFEAHYEQLYALARTRLGSDEAERRCIAAFHKIISLISENMETPRLGHDSLLHMARRFILPPQQQIEPHFT